MFDWTAEPLTLTEIGEPGTLQSAKVWTKRAAAAGEAVAPEAPAVEIVALPVPLSAAPKPIVTAEPSGNPSVALVGVDPSAIVALVGRTGVAVGAAASGAVDVVPPPHAAIAQHATNAKAGASLNRELSITSQPHFR